LNEVGLLTAPQPAVPVDSNPDSGGNHSGAIPATASTSLASTIQHPASNIQHPTPAATPSIGDRLLVEAASRLARRRSLTARLRHQVFIHGQQLFGVGYYWQEGRGEDLKTRLELQIAGQDSRLLQVSNSRFQWLDRALPAGRTVSRVDLRQLRAVLAGENTEVRPGEASWSPGHTDFTANFSGLPRLLATLAENFSFLPPQAMRLVPAQGSQASGVPFFAVVGHWKQEMLQALIGADRSVGTAHSTAHPTLQQVPLPKHIPQEVLLLVDQAELFPYRIEYRPLETPATADSNGRPIAYQISTRPLVVLEFSNVAFDEPIAAGQFDYAPPDVDWIDHTTAVLERLRVERQPKVAAQNGPSPSTLPAR
jgi:hypothetical protein